MAELLNPQSSPEMKSFWAKKDAIKREWHLLDAKDQVLGRLSSRIAKILMGKTKATYTPSVDCGDFVVAVNAGKIRLTGNKLEQKVAFHHTMHPGGARYTPYKKLMAEKPERALFLAVKRMLPKTKLASRQILRLKIYRNERHPHQAQNLKKETI
jgi:large subunit ribosomal protein L13